MTEDLLKYFEKDALSFSVYGNPTSAKFKKMLTQQETMRKESKKMSKQKAREEVKEAAASKADSKPKAKTETKVVAKKEKKVETIKMKTADGREVEVVKEKQGCCTIF